MTMRKKTPHIMRAARFLATNISSYLRLSCLMGLSGILAGCYYVAPLPMHNPSTGEDIVCHGGHYNVGKDEARDTLAGTACVHACERYGFFLVGHPEVGPIHPAPPPDDLKYDIPDRCLP